MYSVFRDLAIIILSAKFFALVARKCKAPQVVGEIIAGLIIGPCLLNLDARRPHCDADRLRRRLCAAGRRYAAV